MMIGNKKHFSWWWRKRVVLKLLLESLTVLIIIIYYFFLGAQIRKAGRSGCFFWSPPLTHTVYIHRIQSTDDVMHITTTQHTLIYPLPLISSTVELNTSHSGSREWSRRPKGAWRRCRVRVRKKTKETVRCETTTLHTYPNLPSEQKEKKRKAPSGIPSSGWHATSLPPLKTTHHRTRHIRSTADQFIIRLL